MGLSVGLMLYFEIFPDSQRDFGIFLNVALAGVLKFPNSKKRRLYFQIATNSLKSWEIGILEVSLILYLSDCEDSLSDTVCLLEREGDPIKDYITSFQEKEMFMFI